MPIIRVTCTRCGAEFPLREERITTARCPICSGEDPNAGGSASPGEDTSVDPDPRPEDAGTN